MGNHHSEPRNPGLAAPAFRMEFRLVGPVLFYHPRPDDFLWPSDSLADPTSPPGVVDGAHGQAGARG